MKKLILGCFLLSLVSSLLLLTGCSGKVTIEGNTDKAKTTRTSSDQNDSQK